MIHTGFFSIIAEDTINHKTIGMFINGILRSIEIVMEQSVTSARLSRHFTVLDKWSASSVSNERFANASDILAELQ